MLTDACSDAMLKLRLQANLPPGRGFVCMDTAELPKILKRIFTDVMLR